MNYSLYFDGDYTSRNICLRLGDREKSERLSNKYNLQQLINKRCALNIFIVHRSQIYLSSFSAQVYFKIREESVFAFLSLKYWKYNRKIVFFKYAMIRVEIDIDISDGQSCSRLFRKVSESRD